MRKIIASAFVSLDGVMQGPGGPTEDPTGGFKYCGWLAPIADGDEVLGKIGELFFTGPFDLLLGRRTYDIFAAFWPYVTGDQKPMGDLFDRARKYVVTHGEKPLTWQNSERLASIDAVARVKNGDGPNLIIQGSSTLYPPLLAAGLIDRLILMTFPVVLGSGKRLFGGTTFETTPGGKTLGGNALGEKTPGGKTPGEHTPSVTMRMIDHVVSARGNMVATFEPAGPVQIGSFATPEQIAKPSQAEIARRKAMADGTW